MFWPSLSCISFLFLSLSSVYVATFMLCSRYFFFLLHRDFGFPVCLLAYALLPYRFTAYSTDTSKKIRHLFWSSASRGASLGRFLTFRARNGGKLPAFHSSYKREKKEKIVAIVIGNRLDELKGSNKSHGSVYPRPLSLSFDFHSLHD